MKAHIRGALTPLVLLYCLPGDEGYAVFRAQAEQLGIAVRLLSPLSLGETVGALADGADEPALQCTPDGPAADACEATPLLLMAHFPDALVNTLLNALRAQSAPPLLKAVVTKHNRAWTLRALLQELLREQQKMKELQHENDIR